MICGEYTHTARGVAAEITIIREGNKPHFLLQGRPRGLAGKPLAGFCTTPSRRITVVYGVIVYAIRFKTPSLHR